MERENSRLVSVDVLAKLWNVSLQAKVLDVLVPVQAQLEGQGSPFSAIAQEY